MEKLRAKAYNARICKYLNIVMKRQGCGYADLATLTGLSYQHIHNILHKNRPMNIGYIMILAEALDVEITLSKFMYPLELLEGT